MDIFAQYKIPHFSRVQDGKLKGAGIQQSSALVYG